jgi:hypothetical protein
MDSGLIGKIDKARKYAEEKERVTITSFTAVFHGNHDDYQVSFNSSQWRCQCLFFSTRGVCSHTMALQRILDDMLAKAQQSAEVV